MKKLLFLLLLCPLLTFAQVDSTKTKSAQAYCVVVASPGGLFHNKMDISIDYGIEKEKYTAQQLRETGIFAGFKSMAEALNYMALQGWEFVSAYTIPKSSTNDYVLHYIYRRKL